MKIFNTYLFERIETRVNKSLMYCIEYAILLFFYFSFSDKLAIQLVL